MRYLDDTIVLSKTHAWTYVRIPGARYEFLSYVLREAGANALTLALNGLLSGGMATVDAHLIVTSRSFEVDAWADQLNQRVASWRPKPAWNGYIYAMTEHLHKADFTRKATYLGVNLGPRSQFDFTVGGAKETIRKALRLGERALLLDDADVSDEEIAEWHEKAAHVRRSLASSHIHAEGATAKEVAWLIRKPLWADNTPPEVTASDRERWGRGELESLGESVIINNYRHLEVSQFDPDTGEDVTGFTATLAVTRFPEVMYFPEAEPWIHYSQTLPFPVDHSIRFTLVPPQKARKDITRTLDAARDQAKHISDGGIDVPYAVQEQLAVAERLQHEITKSQVPWIYSRYRMRISAATETELKTNAKRVIDHYRDLNIDVVLPSGDQLDLLLESMPGDRVRSNAYLQRQEVPVLAGGMPTATSDVGDEVVRGQGWLSPYIGEVTSRLRAPVFFAPHVPIAQDKAAGVAIIGNSGGGKSFFAFTLAYQAAVAGVWTLYIDPKGDGVPMGRLPGLGSPRVFDLRNGHDGMLDPFALGGDIAQAKLLAIETLRLLLGGTDLSAEREAAILRAVEAVGSSPHPSLHAVVQYLRGQDDIEARNVGDVLSTLSQLDFARLCFAPYSGARLSPEDGLTIITLLGLDFPEKTVPPEHYSYENRLTVTVMYLLTRYARQLMLSMDKNHPKAIFIDEAWAITTTPAGAKLIPETARMGRAFNTALVLVTQNARDLKAVDVENSIATVFAFGTSVDSEAEDVLALLGTEASDANKQAVRELYKGECLMRDWQGRIARVQIDAWEENLFRAFDTNPITRKNDTSGTGG